jgi:hypothetical protein
MCFTCLNHASSRVAAQNSNSMLVISRPESESLVTQLGISLGGGGGGAWMHDLSVLESAVGASIRIGARPCSAIFTSRQHQRPIVTSLPARSFLRRGTFAESVIFDVVHDHYSPLSLVQFLSARSPPSALPFASAPIHVVPSSRRASTSAP